MTISAHGRHRRQPRNVRNAVVAVATLGAATAAPLFTSTAAHADTGVWDRVAQCESTGNWQINTGNGFYGGLQFTHQTWIAYGGGQYAYNANGATRAQQIAVAQRTLAGQGPGAWPVCSIQAGLTRGNGGTSVAPAADPAPAPKPAPKPAPVQQTQPSSSSATTNSVRQAPAPAQSSAPATTPTTTSPAADGKVYVVQTGDCLSKIASDLHVQGGWPALYTANKKVVGADPNLIFPGQQLTIG